MSNLVCQICNYSHPTMISPTHLKKHKITGDEYKKQFPGCVLRIQSAETKEKMSASKLGAVPWNKGLITGANEKLSLAKRGKTNLLLRGQTRTAEQKQLISEKTKEAMKSAITDEVRAKLRKSIEARKEAGVYVPPMLGKTHTCLTKAKLSLSSKRINALKSAEVMHQFIERAKAQEIAVLSVKDNYWFNFQCQLCSTPFTFSRQVFRQSTKNGHDLCPTCHPRSSGRSQVEIEFFEAIKELWPTAIPNDRQVLGGKEIDVLIHELQIGFEFTGMFWHAEKQNPEKKHLLWKKQYAAAKGIKLYTVFEDEWRNSSELVLSRISSILGLGTTKVFARQCSLGVIHSKERAKFLRDNHLQGADSPTVALGLTFENEVVCLASFKKTNVSKGGNGAQWELSRFCTKKKLRVVGGASRLIKAFMTTHNSECLDLISYADSRWSHGEMYKSIGFSFLAATAPSYWYLRNGYTKRVHRSALMKHTLLKSEEDKALTEWELAQREGYDRIWDCGTTKWILRFTR